MNPYTAAEQDHKIPHKRWCSLSPGVHTHRTSCERVRTRVGGSLRHSRGRLTPSAAGNDDPGQGICFFLLLLPPLLQVQVQLTGVVTARLALLATHQLSSSHTVSDPDGHSWYIFYPSEHLVLVAMRRTRPPRAQLAGRMCTCILPRPVQQVLRSIPEGYMRTMENEQQRKAGRGGAAWAVVQGRLSDPGVTAGNEHG